jgi:glycosyltransferase involved in cell wall biosynthesis
MGLPIVMARNVGAAELFRHEHDAWLLPGGADVKTLARALDTLASHPDLRARLGNKAHLRAEDYSWDKMTRSVEAVYRTVSHTQRRRRKGVRA